MGILRYSMNVMGFGIVWLLMVSMPGYGQTIKGEQLYTATQKTYFINDASNYISLKAALEKIEKTHNISFFYKWHLISNKTIPKSILESDSLSEEFGNILADFGLTYKQHTDRTYLITEKEGLNGDHLKAYILQEVVRGQVLDGNTGETLPGVNILVKGTSTGTSTDAGGRFQLTVPSLTDTLIFSFIGYQSLEVPINGQTELSVQLQPQAVTGEEVVVVGFGTQERADLTGAVSTVDIEQTIGTRPITDLGRGLQGAVPGLTITTPTGALGTNPSISLRGLTGSLNSAGAEPLILVDGVEVESLNQINPSDIESISVLKDAASTAVYGTRAAWGAILITTKFGEKGSAPKVNYSNNFSFATPTTDLELAPAAEGAEMALSALQRANPSTNSFDIIGMHFDEIAITKMREWEEQYGDQTLSDEMVMGRDFEIRDGKLFFYRPWDAGDMYMKDWTPMQNHNLSVSGGNEHTSYNIGLGYLGESGVLKVNTDKWERYNVNIGIKSSVNSWLDARGKFIFAQTVNTSPYTNRRGTYDSWYYLYRWQRTYPYGTYQGRPFRSSVTELEQANESSHTSALSRISVGATANIAEGLTIDTDFTYASKDNHLHQTGGEVTAYNFWAGTLDYQTYTSSGYNNVNYTSAWNKRGNLRAVTTYQNDIADHSFKIMGGGESELFESWSQYSQKNGLLDPDKGEFDLATGDQFASGGRGHWATLGFFGRINYSFKDKYLIQLNGRYDGSSRFPSNNQWGFFPSVSVGYKITDEPFMEFTQPILSFLKLRGSYGSVGNSAVGSYAFISTMSSENSDWLINNSEAESTFSTPGAVSQTLTWETVTTLDVGMDARFFEDKFSMTFDWYTRTTSNMLSAGITLPSSFGTGAPERNYGELKTRGWELELGWNHSFNQESYINVTGMLSNFEEEITKFANTTKEIPISITNLIPFRSNYYTGMVLGDIWGYETDRFFTEDDFQQDANGNLLTDENGDYILKDGIPDQSIFESGTFSYGPGDIKYKDLNGDGVIDYGSNTVDDPGDQKVIGNSTPKFQYGLRIGGGWKGFDASIFIQGVGKREFWADGPIFVPGYRPHEGWYTHQLDYWTPENPDAYYPRPTDQLQSSDAKNFLPQTKYLLDMSYLRMKNITIGYTLPADMSNKALIENLRVYVSAENLFEFDNLDIPIDPEMNYTRSGLNDSNTFGRVYPFRRVLSVGINMTF